MTEGLALTRSAVLSTDGKLAGLLIEIVQYTGRTRDRSRRAHQLSDQGFLNIAFGSRSVAENLLEKSSPLRNESCGCPG
ncbi:hypothetical protein [Streptomyces sp. NBC_00280]|uniref:hypothetical protein n=1 Tax=Streptomyces sp. NBC_00280 TaxID=2975699 RepID=UPI00324D2B8E